ncbi:MAG: cysteine peptidase family C39 domain-containing protein [Fimbriimonadaceae bacterium]
MRVSTFALAGLLLGVGGIAVYSWKLQLDRQAEGNLTPVQKLARAESLSAKEKRGYLEGYVANNSSIRNEQIQDAVTSARMRLAYLDAAEKKPEDARKQFLEAEEKHAGTDSLDPNYGAMTDQARYQAINCLMIEKKESEAKKEYLAFIKERPLSPLVFGVHKRLLKMLDENETREGIDQLLQVAVDKQAAHNKRELALCGPRCVEKLLKLKLKPQIELDTIEKACGTTDDGTSMSGMQKGLETLGIKTEGMLVSFTDFNKTSLPFIWLDKQHYLLVHTRKMGKVVVYDPFIRNDREIAVTDEDANFSATILKLK